MRLFVFKSFLRLYRFFQSPLQWWFFFNWWFRKRSRWIKIGERILWRWLKIGLGVGEFPWTLWRVEIILKIMVIWLGIWVILIRIIPTRHIWLVHVVHCRVRVIRVTWGRGEIWIHIIIERIVVIKIHITVYKKENKQTNKQQRKRKRKQAYARVDLDLDDS